MTYTILDLETTGLEPAQHQILELSFMTADTIAALEYETPRTFIMEIDEDKSWDEVPLEMHRKSGLLADLFDDTIKKYSLTQVDIFLSEYLESREGPHYLVGNSIYFDRSFIREHMPHTEEALHYRMIDITSIALTAEACGYETRKQAVSRHRAKDDILASRTQLFNLIDDAWTL